ncbi:MAG: CCA tRNA nucleotidyltransferase [Rickettsiales bacterium]|nr:MAG: CCA tRNA nucleotidyltransferase [Rickettsiales bacterium]
MEVENDLILLYSIFKNNLRIVGGAIRNRILKLPERDYDFSCLLKPDDVKELLNKNNIKYITTGEDFGTITALINGRKYEITSTRKDVKTDGRHTEIEYEPDFEVDSWRRDFTFNALYMDIQGKIYDYHNGLSDLDNGIVRFIGEPEKRIQEDYLRILRFFRFFAHFGISLDEESLEAVKKLKDGLKRLSAERIRDEMYKLLYAKYPILALKIMQDAGILDIIDFDGNIKNMENFYLYKNLTISTEMLIALYVDKIPRWILSKKAIDEINSYLEIKHLPLYTKTDVINIFFDQKSQNLAIFNAIMNNGDVESIIALYKKVKNIRLPVNGYDFFYIEDKKVIGEKLKEAKELFIESNFTLTKQELLEKLK